MNIVPVLLVKNEEVWIRHIVSALASVFQHIIVTDTGSTDGTVAQIRDIPQVLIFEEGPKTPPQLTEMRQFMQLEAKILYKATHIFLVDGDELYPRSYLRLMVENPMAEDALSGFTTGIEVGEKENGELWFYGQNGNPVGLQRQAIIPVDSHWHGTYPFESPSSYEPGNPSNHYFPLPSLSQGFYHLHHTTRSRNDAEVYLRSEKKNQFSLREVPQFTLDKFWLSSEKEYRDE